VLPDVDPRKVLRLVPSPAAADLLARLLLQIARRELAEQLLGGDQPEAQADRPIVVADSKSGADG
jgi:hypothetical protein